MRFTRKVFYDLAIWMVGFGLAIGVVFPFFAVMLGVPRDNVLTPTFFFACLCAGALAGIINYGLAHWVVGLRLRILSSSMHHVEKNLQALGSSGDLLACTPEKCAIAVDSEDEIGDSARAFNRLVESLANTMRTQAAVRSFSEMLTSQLEIENLAENALHQFFEHAGATGGLIVCQCDGEMKLAAAHGLREPESLANSEYVLTAMRTSQNQVITIPEHVRVEDVMTDSGPQEVLALPIIYKRVPLGVLVLASASTFSADHRARIELFLHGLGLALNNAMAHDRLQRLAALDPLTGIYNRRFGLGRLHEEFERAERKSSPLGILMFDLDHFKAVNDTYGHLVGDRVLKSVCGIVRPLLREGDVLLRYGGEEFVAILPGASAQDLLFIAERARKSVEESTLQDGARSVRVTLSAGGVAFPNQKVEREESLVELADEALYKAKKAGRNRVEITL